MHIFIKSGIEIKPPLLDILEIVEENLKRGLGWGGRVNHHPKKITPHPAEMF